MTKQHLEKFSIWYSSKVYFFWINSKEDLLLLNQVKLLIFLMEDWLNLKIKKWVNKINKLQSLFRIIELWSQ